MGFLGIDDTWKGWKTRGMGMLALTSSAGLIASAVQGGPGKGVQGQLCEIAVEPIKAGTGMYIWYHPWTKHTPCAGIAS